MIKKCRVLERTSGHPPLGRRTCVQPPFPPLSSANLAPSLSLPTHFPPLSLPLPMGISTTHLDVGPGLLPPSATAQLPKHRSHGRLEQRRIQVDGQAAQAADRPLPQARPVQVTPGGVAGKERDKRGMRAESGPGGAPVAAASCSRGHRGRDGTGAAA